MRNKLAFILFLLGIVVANFATANAAALQNDSIYLIESEDSLQVTQGEVEETYVSTSTFKPDAQKSVWLAAVVPGLGQIYNRQYWKVPIIYAGTLGLVYGITWNDRMYVDYRKGYIDLMDNNPDTNYFNYLLPDRKSVV